MLSQLSVNQSPISSHHDRFWIPASDASSIFDFASRAASSRRLGFAVGVHYDDIPGALVEAAREEGLPLLEV
ncbi:hypothetical protein ACWDLL_28850, partial [Streptomyces griseoincarnatus]